MTSVTFPTSLGGSGVTISDDADPNTGLLNGGHRDRFVPGLQGVVDMASYVYRYAAKIDGAAEDAERAENARGYVEAYAGALKSNLHQYYGQFATLGLDFARGKYLVDDGELTETTNAGEILSVVRASPKWVEGPNGYLREVAPNTIARQWDPVTGKPLGALIEGEATNLFLYSDAPATQTITVTSGTVYTVSVIGSGSADLSGAGTGSATSETPLTFTASTTSLTVTITGSIDYCQVEEGSAASSMIITADSPVTHAADNVGRELGAELNSSRFTVRCQATSFKSNSNAFIFSLSDGTFANRIHALASNAFGEIRVDVTIGGVEIAPINLGKETPGAPVKIEITCTDNYVAARLNDGEIVSMSINELPTVDKIFLGVNAIGSGAYLDGAIDYIVITPTAELTQ